MARPLSLLALSLLLHLIMLQLALFGSGRMSTERPPTPVAVTLLAAPPVSSNLAKTVAPPSPKLAPRNVVTKKPAKDASRIATVKAPTVKAPTMKPPTVKQPMLPTPAATATVPPIYLPEAPISPQQSQRTSEPDMEGQERLDASVDDPLADTTGAESEADNTEPLSPTSPIVIQTDIDLPPSAVLSYEVRYSTKGSITLGTGIIDWQASRGGYAVQGEISKFGFALSSFRSQGSIDDGGVAPTLYWEKNARRAEMMTRFERNPEPNTPQSISFSANASAAPLIPGAQDRASILWQLAGLARAGNILFVPGGRLDILVAGVREAEPWQIDVMGEEWIDIDIESGRPTRAWHMVRTPRPGTRDKRIDIWLAPDRQWYPVKLRYTEISGDYLDLSLAAIR